MKKVFLLLPLLSLGLFSCNEPTTSNIPSEDISSSLSTSEVTAPTTSETTSVSNDTTTPIKETKEWDESSKNLMKEHLNGNIVPFFTHKDGLWVYEEEFDTISISFTGNKEDVDTIFNIIKEASIDCTVLVPEQIDNIYVGMISYVVKETPVKSNLEYSVYLENDLVTIDVQCFNLAATWDEEYIKSGLSLINAEKVTLPTPTFEFNYIRTDTLYVDDGQVTFFVSCTNDNSENYIKTLKENGYVDYTHPDYGEFVTYYKDPTETVYLDIYQSEDNSGLNISVCLLPNY